MGKLNLFFRSLIGAGALVLGSLTSQMVLADVPSSAQEVCPIKVGQTLPEVAMKTLDGKDTTSLKAVDGKPTLFIFYRGSWCPYCNTHLGELKTIEDELKGLGYHVVGISPDLPENLQKSVDKNELSYTLLSDSKAEFAKAMGLAFKVDEDTFKMLKGYDIDIEKASGETHRILPVPAAVLVSAEGEVDFLFFSPDYKVRVNKKVLLAAATAAVK